MVRTLLAAALTIVSTSCANRTAEVLTWDKNGKQYVDGSGTIRIAKAIKRHDGWYLSIDGTFYGGPFKEPDGAWRTLR